MTEKHFVKVENDQEVTTVHHKTDSDKWIFFCHGFGSNKKGSYEKRAEKAVEEGWNAVRFDFRGNGESDGEFIDQNLSTRIEDLKSVIEYFKPEKYVLYGSSFGGKVVFHATKQLNPEAVIGRAPVTYNEIMQKFRSAVKNKGEFEYIPGKPIDQRFFDDFEEYSFDNILEFIDVPVIIFHGAADTTVHPEHSFKAAEKLETDVSLHKLREEDHSFTEQAEKLMLNQIFSWLKDKEI